MKTFLIILFLLTPTLSFAQIACTEEGKVCPNGTVVSRVGTNCEFAPCPNEEFDPFPLNRGTIYEYSQDDLPDICFFGEGARWNGFDVTIQDWKLLTDYQKTEFIEEVVDEIEKQTNSKINVDNYWKLLQGTNEGVDYFTENVPTSRLPMLRFFFEFFKSKGMIEDNSNYRVFGNIG